HASRLALQIAEVIELGAADPGRAEHLDFGDGRRMQWEDALDALAERDFAHRKRRARPAAVHANHDTLEDLDALLVALADLDVYFYRVARSHCRALGEL